MTTGPSLTKQDLEKIANLARLNLTQQELDLYLSQISAIFDYLEIIKTTNLPANQPENQPQTNNNSFRKDLVQPSMPKPILLSNASSDGNYVIAPQTIHKE